MANKKKIDEFKNRWTQPVVSDWKPPKRTVKKTEPKKNVKKG